MKRKPSTLLLTRDKAGLRFQPWTIISRLNFSNTVLTAIGKFWKTKNVHQVWCVHNLKYRGLSVTVSQALGYRCMPPYPAFCECWNYEPWCTHWYSKPFTQWINQLPHPTKTETFVKPNSNSLLKSSIYWQQFNHETDLVKVDQALQECLTHI